MKRVYLIAGIFVILFSNQCFGEDITYQHTITIDQITLQWALDAESISIKLSAHTTGWVGIGFNPTEDMKDANFILGYVKDGKVKVRDDYGSSLRKHTKDIKSGGQENITNVSGKEENGTTEIAFTIPLDSKDAMDSVLKTDEDTTVLLAYGAGRDSFLSKHKYHAVMKVNLSTGVHHLTHHH